MCILCLYLPGSKDCDLSKSALSSLHTSNAFGQMVTNSNSAGTPDSNGTGRIHVSGNICDPHNMHSDQVSKCSLRECFIC